MRPARGRGSRGGADVLTLPWGSVVPRHSAMHDRCIRAAPCLSKRNKLSEPRWAFERQDPAGHMFFCVPDVRSTRPFLVAQWSQTGRGRIARASRARARRGRELRARFAGRAASMGRGRTSRRRSRARVLGECVRSIVASGSAKLVAKNYAFGLRKVCEEVRRKKGAATRC